jgi:protein SCO1/2
MKKIQPARRRWASILWLLAIGAALSMQPATAASPWGEGYFPDVTLTTQDGRPVRFYQDLVKGKSVAINVIYTSCTDECPLETARMAEVQRLLGDKMGKNIFFYSISIDPGHDTPPVLKAYAEKFGVGPGWFFLTGKKEDITLLTKKLGLSRSSDASSKDGHASSLMLGDEPNGQWMRNSAVDNPRFLATTMANFFGWKDAPAAASYAQARPVDTSKAKFMFESRCASCHTIGGGDRIGPDLMHVGARREHAWLTRYLKEPDRMLQEGDPTATLLFNRYRQLRMPNLKLGEEDVSGLLGYIDAQSKAPAPPGKAHHHH